MDYPFSRVFGAGTHRLSTTDLNVLADTSLGLVNFVLPSIESVKETISKQGYSVGNVGVFPINITDISGNALVNNITIVPDGSDLFSNTNPNIYVINTNNGNAMFKPVANGIWNITVSGAFNGGGGGGITKYGTTIDATPVVIDTLVIPLNATIFIESFISCHKISGIGVGANYEGNSYKISVKAQNIGGVVTIGVVQNSFTSKSISAFNATFDVNITNVRVIATGAVNDIVNWSVMTKFYST